MKSSISSISLAIIVCAIALDVLAATPNDRTDEPATFDDADMLADTVADVRNPSGGFTHHTTTILLSQHANRDNQP